MSILDNLDLQINQLLTEERTLVQILQSLMKQQQGLLKVGSLQRKQNVQMSLVVTMENLNSCSKRRQFVMIRRDRKRVELDCRKHDLSKNAISKSSELDLASLTSAFFNLPATLPSVFEMDPEDIPDIDVDDNALFDIDLKSVKDQLDYINNFEALFTGK